MAVFEGNHAQRPPHRRPCRSMAGIVGPTLGSAEAARSPWRCPEREGAHNAKLAAPNRREPQFIRQKTFELSDAKHFRIRLMVHMTKKVRGAEAWSSTPLAVGFDSSRARLAPKRHSVRPRWGAASR